MQRLDHPLPWNSPGIERHLTVLSFGAGPRKAYIQAALHADELPGMRVAVELRRRLVELEAAGQLLGRIELVPVANPLGLSQMLQATHMGRFDFNSGKNFNRDFPALATAAGERLQGRLDKDASANVALIRQTLHALLDELPAAASATEGLQRLLLRHACDADLVLDLHCDFESVLLLYALPQAWPQLQNLAARLGAEAVLLAEDSGGQSFDEACAAPWLQLARAFPQADIPLACLTTTVELRGMADTEAQQAQADAEAILAYLAERGFIAGNWAEAPALRCAATPFAGAQYAYAPHAGVVSYLQPLGAQVRKGDPLFEVIDPISDQRSQVCASTDGVLYARERLRFAQPGLWLAKVAGAEPIRSGRLLSD